MSLPLTCRQIPTGRQTPVLCLLVVSVPASLALIITVDAVRTSPTSPQKHYKPRWRQRIQRDTPNTENAYSGLLWPCKALSGDRLTGWPAQWNLKIPIFRNVPVFGGLCFGVGALPISADIPGGYSFSLCTVTLIFKIKRIFSTRLRACDVCWLVCTFSSTPAAVLNFLLIFFSTYNKPDQQRLYCYISFANYEKIKKNVTIFPLAIFWYATCDFLILPFSWKPLYKRVSTVSIWWHRGRKSTYFTFFEKSLVIHLPYMFVHVIMKLWISFYFRFMQTPKERCNANERFIHHDRGRPQFLPCSA